MTDEPPSAAAPPSSGTTRAAGAGPWLPGLRTLRAYRREWLTDDGVAGLVLSAMLIPVGMGYAQASGLPAINGLYATIVPLLVYALFGPSRIMVLGPDSTLTAVIAALVVPMSGGSVERAVALAGALALLTAACQLLIGFARLGLLADLFSKPIRIGFLNAIALTVSVGQLPKLLGLQASADGLLERIVELVRGVSAGGVDGVALTVGGLSLALIVGLRRRRPRWPGVLIAVVAATVASAGLDLHRVAGLSVVGPLPQGLPSFAIPWVGWNDLAHLLPGALVISLLSFADTSVLSRSLAARGGYRVSQDQEMLALGAANLAAGLFQGFPVSGSASRTPVAETAGARTQVTGLIGATTIALLLLLAPELLADMPEAALAAVVIAACLSFADLRGMAALYRQHRVEFMLSLASFLGVALVGVLQGIVVAISLSMAVLVWRTWHPYSATLVRVDGRKGYHDASRHPEGRSVPGLVIFRWDAPLFFANAELFDERVRAEVERAQPGVRRVIVAADAITDLDVTAADALLQLERELARAGVSLHFAGLKGPVKDQLGPLGLVSAIGPDRLWDSVGRAVNAYRDAYRIDWRDWDE